MAKKKNYSPGISDRIAQKFVFDSYVKSLDEYQQQDIRRVSLRLSMYYNNWAEALQAYIELVVADTSARKDLTYIKDTTANVVKECINKTSMLYNDKPQRTFMIGRGKTDDVAEDVYKRLKLWKFGKQVNRMYNLLYDVLVLVDWDSEKKLPYFRKLNRANCGVVIDRFFPDRIKKLIIYAETDTETEAKEQYRDDYAKLGQYKIIWTPDEHYIELLSGERMTVPGRSKKGDFKNYYGIIPVVQMHKEPIDGLFWNTCSGGELTDLMLHIGLKNSLDSFAYVWNSFKMIVLTGEESLVKGGWPDTMNLSPSAINKFSTVGGTGKIDVLDLMNNFEMLENYKDAMKKNVFDLYGVRVESHAVQSAQSGISLKIKNVNMAEIRKEQEPDFIEYETDIFGIIRTVWNYWNSNDKISEETKMETCFVESEVFISRHDKLKYYWDLYEKGLKTGAEVYMAFNPTVTETDEAEAKFLENVEKFKKLFGEPSFTQGPGAEGDGAGMEDLDEDEAE